MEKTLFSSSFLLSNSRGITKIRIDISSTRLFWSGVPVSSIRRCACNKTTLHDTVLTIIMYHNTSTLSFCTLLTSWPIILPFKIQSSSISHLHCKFLSILLSILPQLHNTAPTYSTFNFPIPLDFLLFLLLCPQIYGFMHPFLDHMILHFPILALNFLSSHTLLKKSDQHSAFCISCQWDFSTCI